jgi:putative phage-type endonuclease
MVVAPVSAPTLVDLDAVPVLGWEARRPRWLAARRTGLGASDIAAILGFSQYRTPWQVWAEKTDTHRPDDQPSAAADLGNALEPWLLEQACELLDRPVTRTPHQLYAHPEHVWRLASPDGWVAADGRLVETKTAGLASGFGPPIGWTDDRFPLGYELQCRWQMHVTGAPAVELVALVANLGVVRHTVVRDIGIENDLVTQVERWWSRHVVAQVEPPLDAPDNEVLAAMYPQPTRAQVDLDLTDACDHIFAYLDARRREGTARREKETAGAALKRLLGEHSEGRIGGQTAVTWNAKKGEVEWPRLVADLAERAGVEQPDPDTYRKPDSRSLSVKEFS